MEKNASKKIDEAELDVVNNLLKKEIFYDYDVFYHKDIGLYFYEIDADSKINISNKAKYSNLDTSFIFKLCEKTRNKSMYFGGECASHGSIGFFGKIENGYVIYILVSTESNPFIDISFIDKTTVEFLSSSGERWKIDKENTVDLKIDRMLKYM